MKKLIVLAVSAGITLGAFAMSQAPEKGCCGSCGTKEAAVKSACCGSCGAGAAKDKAACSLKSAEDKAGCSSGACSLSK